MFRFEPIRAVCGGDGAVTWTHGEGNQFLFRIADPAHYASAMQTALKTLLMRLPDLD